MKNISAGEERVQRGLWEKDLQPDANSKLLGFGAISCKCSHLVLFSSVLAGTVLSLLFRWVVAMVGVIVSCIEYPSIASHWASAR